MRAATHTLAIMLCLLATLAGCNKASAGRYAPAPDAPKERASDERRATLAVTRHVDMEVAPEAVAPLFASTQAACEADTASACVVMASHLNTGDYASAELTVRAAPAGIARLLAKLHSGAGLVGESTSAEDLAAPIVDAERRLAMMREYRDSLLTLRAKAGSDIKALMSVNEELARVQSQLETATGERAHLQQRIDTETLTVSIASPGAGKAHPWRAIPDALREFGAHLAEAAAGAITFVAYAIPWAIVLLPLGWCLRWLWRRRRTAR